MVSDQWYAVKRDKNSKVVYLLCGGDRRMVEATASAMYRSPIIVKLTWMMMKVLSGCMIPDGTALTDYCHGEIHIPRDDRKLIVIKVL